MEEAIGKTVGDTFTLWYEGGDGRYGYEYTIVEVKSQNPDIAEYGDTIVAEVRETNTFDAWEETIIWSCLQGIMGAVYTNDAEDAAGFMVSSSAYWDSNIGKYCTSVSPFMISVVDGKIADSKMADGTLKVVLNGFSEAIEIKNFKMKYSYEKPKLEARKATTGIASVAGNNTAEFAIYDKLNKSYLYYSTDETCMESYVFYSFSYENENVEAIPNSDHVKVKYSGIKEKETVTYTLDSYGWREPLTVKQTIKVVAPKASLSPAVITYNKAYASEASTFVQLSNVSEYVSPQWIDLEVKGADAKAKALVEKDILEITRSNYAQAPLKIVLNRTSLMNRDTASGLKAGTYKFKVTPYYRNQDTGNKVKLNTMNLSIKVVDKPVTVKVTPKGSLDIAKVSGGSYDLLLKSDFKNLGQDYAVIDAKLKGEYSKYFKVVRKDSYNQTPANYYSLQLSELGKVQAGRKYKLTVEYTVGVPGGDTFKVQSNVFTIKPKQSTPKVTVQKNNQVLYASAETKHHLWFAWQTAMR